MRNGDIVADRRNDGSYLIRWWRSSDGALLPIDGHDESYDEEEMYRRLNLLGPTGDTYVRDSRRVPASCSPDGCATNAAVR